MKQTSDHANGNSTAGTTVGLKMTVRESGAKVGVPTTGKSGENADKGNRNKRS